MSSMSMFEVRHKQRCENIIYYLMKMSENSQIVVDKDFQTDFVFPINSLVLQEQEGKPSETDSIKFKISSKTSRGKKKSTKIHHHRHHKRQPDKQQFPKHVVTG